MVHNIRYRRFSRFPQRIGSNLANSKATMAEPSSEQQIGFRNISAFEWARAFRCMLLRIRHDVVIPTLAFLIIITPCPSGASLLPCSSQPEKWLSFWRLLVLVVPLVEMPCQIAANRMDYQVVGTNSYSLCPIELEHLAVPFPIRSLRRAPNSHLSQLEKSNKENMEKETPFRNNYKGVLLGISSLSFSISKSLSPFFFFAKLFISHGAHA